MIVPVSSKFDGYAQELHQTIHDAGFRVETDLAPGDTFNKKIRNAQLSQWNYILVVGEKESTNKTVNVRTRDNVVHGEKTLQQLIDHMTILKTQRTINDDSSEF
jgi:threonyl-tRNA synthetase